MISLQRVVKTFPGKSSSVHAVKDATLSIEPGEIYGIVGFSGAGKSTLVRCINLLERPTSGQVFVDGVELTKLSGSELNRERKKIGMIFQQFNLFATRTVFENVAFPMKYTDLGKKQIEDKANGLLKYVGLEDKALAYPSQLSGGQKQRVAIARALASDPKVLLCDEATSALDPQTTISILKLLKKLNQETGITIVVISHQMQVVKEICGRVVVMEDGRLVEEGDVFDIFSQPQQPITKAFVDTSGNLNQIDTLLEEDADITHLSSHQCLLRLKFLEKSVGKAIVSYVSRVFDIDLNIIFGNIEMIGGRPLGSLVVIASGKEDNLKQMLTFLKENHVEAEVLRGDGLAQ